MATARNPHADSRLPKVLDEAARLFRTRGLRRHLGARHRPRGRACCPDRCTAISRPRKPCWWRSTSRACSRSPTRCARPWTGETEPWDRLEAACIAHLEAILHDDDYAQVVVRVRPADVPVAHDSLIELRNQYEALFSDLIKDLPLARSTDRRVLRLMLHRRHELVADLVPPGRAPQSARHRAQIHRACCGRARRFPHEQWVDIDSEGAGHQDRLRRPRPRQPRRRGRVCATPAWR